MIGSYDNANPPHVWETPQHECARPGCTRLTAEQECDLHAAEPAGVIHEPKEPRPSRDFEREHFEQALGCYRRSILDTLADEADSSMTREDVANARRREAKELDEVMSRWDTEHDAAKELAAERDEWKRRADSFSESCDNVDHRCNVETERADKAEAERDAARAENAELNELFELQGRRLSDATKRWQAVTGEHGTLPDLGALLAWLLGEIDKANATDPRIAAWRALDAEQRSYRVEDLRTWADLVEAGVAPDGADHGPSPLRIAAAALEALGEKP